MTIPGNRVEERLRECASRVDKALDSYIPIKNTDYCKLTEAMRYSTLSGGKRIRPFLTLAFAKIFGTDQSVAMPYACALEMIHTYSLIHDDLPSMDNDDMRRGRPTSHKVFGEAGAILAGDALLTKAFEIAAGNEYASASMNLTAVRLLAAAAGESGMVGGQQMDIEGKAGTLEDLVRLQSLKTGEMIRCAGLLGLLAAGEYENEKKRKAVYDYCSSIGLCFQIVDDIIDSRGNEELTGKSLSDKRNEKVTFLSFMSCEKAAERARELTESAVESVKEYDSDGILSELARYLLKREK